MSNLISLILCNETINVQEDHSFLMMIAAVPAAAFLYLVIDGIINGIGEE